jgi:hypothetical protein
MKMMKSSFFILLMLFWCSGAFAATSASYSISAGARYAA